jgi:hypothetical protein
MFLIAYTRKKKLRNLFLMKILKKGWRALEHKQFTRAIIAINVMYSLSLVIDTNVLSAKTMTCAKDVIKINV